MAAIMDAESPGHESAVWVGSETVVLGRVSGVVGDRSVAIGATDQGGNTIVNDSVGLGFNACAAPGCIAIGAHAQAGADDAAPSFAIDTEGRLQGVEYAVADEAPHQRPGSRGTCATPPGSMTS